MKTILSLLALATFAGLLPLALAESKTTKPGAAGVSPGDKRSKATSPDAAPAPKSSAAKPPAKPAATPKTNAAKSAPAKSASAKEPTGGTSLTSAQQTRLLALLNEGTFEELDAIPGIAATRADSIVSERPFTSVSEVALVSGVGAATFEKILAHGKSLTSSSSAKRVGSSSTKAKG